MQQPSAVAAPISTRPSGRPSTRTSARTLSARLWGLKWKKVLPRRFAEVSISVGTFDEALPFVTQHYGRIFGISGPDSRFLVDAMTETKRRFGAEMDVFFFRAPEGTVGVIMGHPSDWSTYYIRTAAFLPEYRSRHLSTNFLEAIYKPLRLVGCERVEAETSPANMPMVRVFVNQGFMMTSTANSERWGYLARFTKFLKEDAEIVFRRQYCVTAVRSETASTSATNQRRRS